MEIRCTKCGHLGAAADVRSVDGGVGLVCGACDHINVVAAGDSGEASRGEDGRLDGSGGFRSLDPRKFLGATASGGASSGGGAEGPSFASDEEFVDRSMERLMPKPGSGRRCRKCAHLFESEDVEHCVRCGLSVAQAQRYEEGEAPWELPPPGREEAQKSAGKLWEATVASGEADQMAAFVDFVIAVDLLDFGIRRIQHRLVDKPEEQAAKEGLRKLAKNLKISAQMAQSRAEAKADEFSGDIERFRTGFLVAALVFWTVILLLFSWLFLR